MQQAAQPDAFVLPPPPPIESSEQQPAVGDHTAGPPPAAIAQVKESSAPPPDLPDTALKRIEERQRQAENIAAKKREEERLAQEIKARRQAEEIAREAQQAEQRRAEEERMRLAEQMLVERLAQERAQREAAELEARRQAEREAERAAEKLARQAAQRAKEEAQRLRAMERLREENAERARLAEAQRQEAERAQRFAEAQEAQRQAKVAAQPQNTAAAELQDSVPEGASESPPRGVHPAQDGTMPGAGQMESAYAPPDNPARAAVIEERSNHAADVGDGPFELSDEQMAGARVVQERKIDVTRLEPEAAHALIAATPDTRRRSIFGGAEDDIVLKMYIADWRQKVERNARWKIETSSMPRPRGESLVTVALRQDGSVENVTVHRSRGQGGLDDQVRQIVLAELRYKAFPTDLATRYDVIEIRRIWQFDDALHILDEAR